MDGGSRAARRHIQSTWPCESLYLSARYFAAGTAAARSAAGRDKSGVGVGLVLSVSIPRLLALPSRRVERWKNGQTQECASRTGPYETTDAKGDTVYYAHKGSL